MTKEQQIEEIAKDINTINSLQASTIYTPTYQEALCLYNLGYRKKDEGLKAFAERLKERMIADYVNGKVNMRKGYITENDIDELLKESLD